MRWLMVVACLVAGPAGAQQGSNTDWYMMQGTSSCAIADGGPARMLEGLNGMRMQHATRDVKDSQTGQVVEVEVRFGNSSSTFYRGRPRCEVALSAAREDARARDDRLQQGLARYR